jgi:hypothetical protein
MHPDHVLSSDSLCLDSAVLSLENGQPITAVDLRLVVEEPAWISFPHRIPERAAGSIRITGRTAAPISEGTVLRFEGGVLKHLHGGLESRELLVARVRRLAPSPMNLLEFYAESRR